MLDHSYMSKCHIRAWGICAAAFLTTTVLASGTATAATSYAATTRQNMGSAVNLVIYNGDPPASQYFNNINAVFEKAHHVTITSVYYPLDTFLTNFEAAVAGHANINILMDPGRDIAFLQQQGDLVPVTGLIPTSRFRPSMLTPYVHDNKLWAYPVGNVDATGVIYNLALLDKFHLSPPTTFAQVIAAGKISGAKGYSALDAEGGSATQLALWFMQTLEQASHGNQESLVASQVSTGTPSWSSPTFAAAMNAIYELAKAPGVFEPGVAGVSEQEAISLFDAGKTAMFYAGDWDLAPAVLAANFPVSTAPFPTYISGAPSEAVGGAGETAEIYSGSPKSYLPIEEQYLQYITSPAADSQLNSDDKTPFAVDAGVPTPASALSGATPQYRNFTKAVLTKLLPHLFVYLDWTWPAPAVAALNKAVGAVMGGVLTPAAALASVQKVFKPVKG